MYFQFNGQGMKPISKNLQEKLEKIRSVLDNNGTIEQAITRFYRLVITDDEFDQVTCFLYRFYQNFLGLRSTYSLYSL